MALSDGVDIDLAAELTGCLYSLIEQLGDCMGALYICGFSTKTVLVSNSLILRIYMGPWMGGPTFKK